jgi:hypothetical protein
MIAMAALVGLGVGAPAWAQTAELRALRQQNEILQQQDIARQSNLAALREITAAQSRYETQLTLRALDETRTTPKAPSLRPALPPTPPRGASPDDMAAQAEQIDRMTDERLAESNARLRAITPAR